jgi:cell division protein FtsB
MVISRKSVKSNLFEKIKIKLRLYLGYLLVLLTVIFIISLIRNVFKIATARNEVEKERVRIAKINRENAELGKRLAEVKSQDYIEKQLRDKLGLAKPGEIVVVMPDADTLRKLAPKPVEEEAVLPDPTWKKWLRLFF